MKALNNLKQNTTSPSDLSCLCCNNNDDDVDVNDISQLLSDDLRLSRTFAAIGTLTHVFFSASALTLWPQLIWLHFSARKVIFGSIFCSFCLHRWQHSDRATTDPKPFLSLLYGFSVQASSLTFALSLSLSLARTSVESALGCKKLFALINV